MASNSNEIVTDLSPVLKVYKDGRVERFLDSPYVPPLSDDQTTGVSSKDIKISPDFSARLFLPKMTDPSQKFPVLVYFHGGGFCAESAFSLLYHRYLNLLVSEAKAVAVSVEYRLAPEHPLPTAYEDCWAALQWVASHAADNSDIDKEPWLADHGDFGKLYMGGDSAGGNIVHNMALKAGAEGLNGDVKISGAFLPFPYFWGSNFESTTSETNEKSLQYRVWMFVHPSAPGGIDNALINPLADDAPSLSGIGCSKLIVCIAEKDSLRETAILYVEALRKSGWKGKVELVDAEGEDHCFNILNPDSENAQSLTKLLASFIN